MSCPYDDGSGVAPHPISAESRKIDASNVDLVPIPQVPTHLFGLLGNLPDMDPSFQLKSIWRLADLYGPIYNLKLHKDLVVVSSQKFVNEVCDEGRFEKVISPVLGQLRALLGDGLFTAYPHEKNWWKAHRTLVPAFGPLGM